MLLKRPTEALLLCSRAFLLVERRSTMTKDGQTTDLSLLDKMDKELGFKKVAPPRDAGAKGGVRILYRSKCGDITN
jgi:hypothetical protein